MKEFMREYNALKRIQNSVKNTYTTPLSQRTVISQNTYVSGTNKNRVRQFWKISKGYEERKTRRIKESSLGYNAAD